MEGVESVRQNESRKIKFCIGTIGEHGDDDRAKFLATVWKNKWKKKGEELENKTSLNPDNIYEVSQDVLGDENISSKDKISFNYKPCTGVAMVGIDKETGEKISFLSHHNPISIISEILASDSTYQASVNSPERIEFAKEIGMTDPRELSRRILENSANFRKKLQKYIGQFIERCKPGSVDAVVFGGHLMDGDFLGASLSYADAHIMVIKKLNEIVKKATGKSVQVLSPSSAPRDVYLENDTGRLYFFLHSEDKQASPLEFYDADDIDEVSKGWARY